MSFGQELKPAVVTVGDELMYGERSNANQVWILKTLWQRGIPANIALSLPDIAEEIGAWIQKLKHTGHRLILVSGGIGGTHDDCTREGIAHGLGVALVKHDECQRILSERLKSYNIKPTEQIMRMTLLPQGCELIANPLGAPGFYLDDVYAFPGFPTMLEPMATGILDKIAPLQDDTWITREVVLPVPEGAIGQQIEDFCGQHPNVHIGLYPSTENFRKEVTLRFRAPGNAPELADKFDALVGQMKKDLRIDQT